MSVRPYVTENTAKDIVNRLYGIEVASIEELKSSDDRNFKVSCMESCRDNLQTSIAQPDVNTFILKIVNFSESKSVDFQSVVNDIQNYLLDNGIRCSKNVRDIHGRIHYLHPFPTGDSKGNKEKCLVKLLTYLDGQPLKLDESVYLSEVDGDIGFLLAKIHNILQKFPNTHLAVEPTNPWALENPQVVLEYIMPHMEPKKIEMVEKVIQNFSSKLEDYKSQLPKGVIHGDFHDLNIIVQPRKGRSTQKFDNDRDRILKTYGIIDMNEISHSYLVLEVGRLIGDRLVSFINSMRFDESMELSDLLLTVVSNVLNGYESLRKLCTSELDILYWAISFTFCQYYVLGEYKKDMDPLNTFAYEAVDESSTLLEIWLKIDSSYFLKKIKLLS